MLQTKQPDKAYLFDVDGVLTDPETKRVEQQEIFDQLIERLEKGRPVGLNTGRSLEFIKKQILEPLEVKMVHKHLLQNVVAIGEKGGAWITYGENGWVTQVDGKIQVPQEIQNEVRSLVRQSPYTEVMFYDDTKVTMISVELRRGRTIADFKEPQRQLATALRKILISHNVENEFRIDITRIATDVESVQVGKNLGAKKFVKLLREKGLNPEYFITFGDGISDFTMFEELNNLGKKTTFVFVGEPELLSDKPIEGIVFTNQRVDKGTLEFLKGER